LFDRKIFGFGAFQDLFDGGGRASTQVILTRAVGDLLAFHATRPLMKAESPHRPALISAINGIG
jgi:ABC-type sulfate transport system substrate-binding protein